jgi:hypothetical protein
MTVETKWIKTEHAVYAAIYAVHHESLTVYSTISEDHHWMTAWILEDADGPLMKSEAQGEFPRSMRLENYRHDPRTWSYYIASNTYEEDE